MSVHGPGDIRPETAKGPFGRGVHRSAIAILVFWSLVAPVSAQDRIPGGGVATAPGQDIVAAWYGHPTHRYGHAVLGDGVEGGSLVVRDTQGARHEIVLPEHYVFEDVTPRLADLDGDGRMEVVTIRTELRAGAAVAVFGMDNGTLVQRAASLPIGQPNRWLSIAAVADFTGDDRADIAIVRTPHIGGELEVLSLRHGALHSLYPPQAGYSSHVIGASDVSFATTLDLSGDGIADLIVPEQSLRRLVVLRLDKGVVPIASVDLPARLAGPVRIDPQGRLRVPLETGQTLRIPLD